MAAGPVGRGLTAAAAPPETLELGAVRVHSPVILAPMAGVTDAPFRGVCREFGEEALRASPRGAALLGNAEPGVDAPAGLYVAEMVTARALVEGNTRSWQMVEPDPSERVRSVQLYGTDAGSLGAAARLLVERSLVDHLDLNFGCPVPKVTRKGGGAAIPWKRDLFRDIVTSVVGAVDRAAPGGPGSIPVTVKMRIGIDDDHTTALDAGEVAEAAGVAGVGLHARTQEQHYSGAARWEWIARLKDHLSVPVFGNGDVFVGPDATEMMRQTGCDAVTIGRGAQGRPWLFADVVASLWGLDRPGPVTLDQARRVLLDHARRTVALDVDEARAMREMRKHVGWYLKGFPLGGEARRDLNLVSSLAELEDRLSVLDGSLTLPPDHAGKGIRAGGAKRPHLPHGWLDSQELTDNERSGLLESDDGGSGG